MVIELSGRQIFVASPGGLDQERAHIRATVEKYNQRSGLRAGVAFIARGWEEVPGGIGRPQALINNLVDECDFTVVMLADRWGSPSGDEEASSGTEEEFRRALRLCGSTDAHMRDVLVLFRSVPSAQLADPGEELQKVLAFKKQLQASKKILFATFDDLESLSERIESVLDKWGTVLPPRVAREINLDAPNEAHMSDDTTNIVDRAVELAASGELVQAELLFAKASQGGSPRALSEYARFLRRQGRLTDSKRQNEDVVTELASIEKPSAEQSGFLADSLANIGVIARKRGNLGESLRSLNEAVKVAERAVIPLPKDLAYALDNLGHTLSQLGRPTDAAKSFERAESARHMADDQKGLLASKLNHGWAAVRTSAFASAEGSFNEAEQLAIELDDEEGIARALAGRGSATLKSGRAHDAIDPLQRALEINVRLGQSDGIGMCAGLLARAYVETRDLDAAQRAANETLAESQTSANVTGAVTAKWALAQVARLRGETTTAVALYDEAIEASAKTGNTALTTAIEKDYSRGA